MAHLKWTRIVVYTFTSWLAVVATAASLNSLIKARHDRDMDEKLGEALAPIPDFIINISLSDIFTAGGFLSAGEILLGLISSNSANFLLFPRFMPIRSFRESKAGGPSRGARSFVLGCWAFAFLWTLISAAITLDFGLNRDAKVTASAGGVPLPPATVAGLQAASGLNPAYWIHWYTKFLCVAAWPLLFFSIISIGLTLAAYDKTPLPSAGVYDEEAGVGAGAGAGAGIGAGKKSVGETGTGTSVNEELNEKPSAVQMEDLESVGSKPEAERV